MALNGVNLGGWLVLERWITPSVFEGLKAEDENAFCLELSDAKHVRLEEHRQTFISEEDFKWLAKNGINALRIPLPHWLFGNVEPYVGAASFLDQAMEWSLKNNLKVILDIHTAPGSQNGQDHSGQAGKITWYKDKQNILQSLKFLTDLSSRYGHYANLWGIELLNEPRPWINPRVLKNYYLEGYEIVRQNCHGDVAVIISDYFSPWRWQKFMPEPQFKNIVRDTHLYQCYRPPDKKLSMDQHVKKARNEWRKMINDIQKAKPMLVGEWSLTLTPETFNNVDEVDKKTGLMAYADAQLEAFKDCKGWFYWTYKTEAQDLWNFKHCRESGLL